MRIKTVGNKRDLVALVVYNVDTVQLNIGQAAFLNGLNGATINGINADGLEVVGGINLATNFASALTLPLLYGVCLQNIPVNGYGEVQAFGFVPDIQLTTQTRASSTATWNSYVSLAAYAPLIPETIANGWTTLVNQSYLTGGTATTGVTTFGAGILPNFMPPVILGQSQASYASSAYYF